MTAVTRDGRNWTPDYLLAIDSTVCIGCGRCYKVCGRGVMTLRGVDEDGNLVDDDDDDDGDIDRQVMAMADAGACVGCGACARVCPTNCQTHGAA
ncbi:ferredoxin III, nif-specific [Gluconacetobacter azotocaptans]|uniref:ferredoxin III, nif-specific n=1 Tax=Gluconacetobacter azotocaptans TaxID=142834 RepID=UPI001959201A|nr:ferredoxin III, nif-specific [Gluconacetobacter azotocaptans]MBM9400563.1 ferredoxin III, nif-specific [Gluconacetobacter azotocaptans]